MARFQWTPELVAEFAFDAWIEGLATAYNAEFAAAKITSPLAPDETRTNADGSEWVWHDSPAKWHAIALARLAIALNLQEAAIQAKQPAPKPAVAWKPIHV